MAKRKQNVVGDFADVPEGFVAMASFGARKSGIRGTDRYEWLLKAYEVGSISAVKVMRSTRDRTGPVFVDREQAWELIRSRESEAPPADRVPKAQQPADAHAAVNGAALLASIAVLSNRMELIASGIDRLCEIATARPESWQND